jgi:hypothetical protein
MPVTHAADDHEGRLKQLEDQLAALAHQHVRVGCCLFGLVNCSTVVVVGCHHS